MGMKWEDDRRRLMEKSMSLVRWVWGWRPARINWVTDRITSLSWWRLCLGQTWRRTCLHSWPTPVGCLNTPWKLWRTQNSNPKDDEDQPVYLMFNNTSARPENQTVRARSEVCMGPNNGSSRRFWSLQNLRSWKHLLAFWGWSLPHASEISAQVRGDLIIP